MPFELSDAGLDLIKASESLVLTAYRDPIGVLTVGYGHTGNDVKDGETITEEWANQLLRHDVSDAVACVNRNVKGIANVTQGMFDALVDFTFNLGCASLQSSTLLSLVRVGRADLAAEQFGRWVFAGGRKLKGLEIRREAERKMFVGVSE